MEICLGPGARNLDVGVEARQPDDQGAEGRSAVNNAETRRSLRPASGIRGHAHHGDGGRRAASLRPARGRPLSRRRSAHHQRAHDICSALRRRRLRAPSPAHRRCRCHGGRHRRYPLDFHRILSIVTITFRLNRNIDVAAQDVRDAVAGVISLLPRDAKPPLIKKLDADASPILTLVVSGDQTPRELYEIADRGVKDSIESVGGVGQVVINGGQKRAVNVWVDADRLAAYKIPILQVRDAVARQNSEIPGGRVDEGSRELVLRTLGRFPDPAQFNDLVVAQIGNTPVRIRDIGYAEDGHKEQRTSRNLRRHAGGGDRTAPPIRRKYDRRHQQRQRAAGSRPQLAADRRTARRCAGPVPLHRSGVS